MDRPEAPSFSSPQDGFQIQINNVDSYQLAPTSFDRDINPGTGQRLYSVPIIRVFGSTSTGQNVLVHIHGVYPYLYLEYNGNLSEFKTYTTNLTDAINSAMNKAYRRDPHNARNIFVANIILCKGIPFYGYHVGWKYYLKIYLLSPFYLTKFADLLRNGSVLGVPMQPYESHIPYLLQFFTDFNLTGCGSMNLSEVYFRYPLPNCEDYHSDKISSDLVLDPIYFPRLSYCELEIDIDASAIKNRLRLKQRNLHYDFSENSSAPDSLFIPTLTDLWVDEASRRHNEGTSSFQPPVNASRSQVQSPPWRRGEELKSALQKLIDSDDSNLTFESFLHSDNKSIPTAFDTVSAMFKQSKMDVTKPNLEAQDAEVPKEIEPDLILEGIDFNETSSDPSDHTEDALDPLSQEILIEDGDLSDSDPFGSFTDSIILNETSIQKSFLEVMHSDPSAERIILSQGESNSKRALSQSSENMSRPKSKPFVTSPDSNGSIDFGSKSLSTDILFTSSDPMAFSNQPKTSPEGKALMKNIANSFPVIGTLYGARSRPPTTTEVMGSFELLGLQRKVYKEPYFAKAKDVPPKPVIFAGLEFRLKSDGVQDLPNFSFDSHAFANISHKFTLYPQKIENMQLRYARKPPTYTQVSGWCAAKKPPTPRVLPELSQIRGVTQKGKYNFKFVTQKPLTSRKTHGSKYLSVMIAEVHVNTKGEFHPNPSEDEIASIFWTYQTQFSDHWGDKSQLESGAIFLCTTEQEKKRYQSACTFEIQTASCELDVINTLIDTVRNLDPDILAGYEVNSSSWGYIIERGRKEYDYDLCNMLSRVRDQGHGKVGDKWGITHTSAISITGRHVFNVWRILRGEVNLLKYSLENVVYHTIHQRLPLYSHKTLTSWFTGISATECAKCIQYHFDRVFYTLDLISNQELISRTSEQARIVGIDFYSVFYRGSQYKIEAIMARLSKAENYIMISPSRKQVGEQNALECLPLILEPQTKLYTSPVVVLDFQSLYPSIMIAYNYCYSTCLGRITKWRGRNKLGFTELNLPPGLLNLLKTEINIAPNGMIYVKPSVRKSLLAKMLTEILDTRVMIKDGMKSNKDNSSFQKLMNNRQLALKLIANVTYGYTSASYSGRMPCVEIADSIVQAARETLECAIETIKTTKEWGAEVVYGDTDSLFIHFPGKTKEQAFDLGYEIAQTVTSMNPEPVKLKFEKVYLPCILQTKKRYVGHMYETKSQKVPKFDAKGMETIRRDGTPAQQKIEEKTLQILFDTCDLSQVKAYLEEQWMKILMGKVSVQDFCFAKEVKLGSYRGLGPPGAMIAAEKIKQDAYSGPQYRERVPYVVITGAPGDRLIDRCVDPDVLINNSDIHLDSEYYIMKNLIPPLERILNLLGGNVRQWYDEMPKVLKFHHPHNQALGKKKQANYNLRHFLKDTTCRVCENLQSEGIENGVCSNCRDKPFEAVYTLQQRLRKLEKKLSELTKICQNCAGLSPSATVECISGDCPIYYSRKRATVFYQDSCQHDGKAIESVINW